MVTSLREPGTHHISATLPQLEAAGTAAQGHTGTHEQVVILWLRSVFKARFTFEQVVFFHVSIKISFSTVT